MGFPRDFSSFALFVSLNVSNFVTLRGKLVYSLQFFKPHLIIYCKSLTCMLYNFKHFDKCKLTEEWDKVSLIYVEDYDNELFVNIVYVTNHFLWTLV